MVNRADNYQYLAHSIQRETLELMPKGVRSILDIGGGNGDYAAAAKAITGATIAAIVDISDTAIENKNPAVDYAAVCDIERIGSIETFVESHSTKFDLILCLDVLEHLVDPWRVISRLRT